MRFLQKLLAFIVGYLSSVKQPAFLVRYAIRRYVRIYNVKTSDFNCGRDKIHCFNDFFIRSLQPNARPIGEGFVSPVDAKVSACGHIENNTILQIKGQEIALNKLLCKDINVNGTYLSLYLSPADYHRYHAPMDMELTKITYVPGLFYSVRPEVAKKRKVFLKNERVILECNTANGKLYLIFIAAQNVGKIALTALYGKCFKAKKISDIPFVGQSEYKKGDELGMFHLGSSVVVLAENLSLTCKSGEKILFGQSLGNF